MVRFVLLFYNFIIELQLRKFSVQDDVWELSASRQEECYGCFCDLPAGFYSSELWLVF